MKEFSSKLIPLKVDTLQDRKIYCLQVRPCIFRPGIVQAGVVKGLNTRDNKENVRAVVAP